MAPNGKTDPSADKWMSLVAASRLLGEGRLTVLTRAVKGELEAQHVAGRTVISRASVERFIRKRDNAA